MGTCIEYTADTERWLNDVWCVFAHGLYTGALLDGDEILGYLYLAITNFRNVDYNLAFLLKIQG